MNIKYIYWLLIGGSGIVYQKFNAAYVWKEKTDQKRNAVFNLNGYKKVFC